MQDNEDEQDFSKFCFEKLVKFPKIFFVSSYEMEHISLLTYDALDQAMFPVKRINVINQRFLDVKCIEDLLCEVFPLTKQRKLSFLVHIKSSDKCFELIHIDL